MNPLDEAINFREVVSSIADVVPNHLDQMYTHRQHAPNQRDSCHLYPRLRVYQSDMCIDIQHLPGEENPMLFSFHRDLRFRRQGAATVFLGHWRDSVGCRYVDSRCPGNNGPEKGLGGFPRLTNGSVRLPTITPGQHTRKHGTSC